MLFANDVVLLVSSSRNLQQAQGQFASECEAVVRRISTSKSEAKVFSWKRVDCQLQVGGESLLQVEEFKYPCVLFMSGGRKEQQIDWGSIYWPVGNDQRNEIVNISGRN